MKYRLSCLWLDASYIRPAVRFQAFLARLVARIIRPASSSLALRVYALAYFIALRAWRAQRSPSLDRQTRKLARAIAELARQPEALPVPAYVSSPAVMESALGGILVLKAPAFEGGRAAEKGVIQLKFSARIADFHRTVEMESLLEHYRLVLEPSWSGYSKPALLSFARYRTHPIVMLAPFPGDYEFLESIGTNLVPIELGPGDWVNPSVFRPLASEPKRFDAVLVARWTYVKRHDSLLQALREIGDPSFRVALLSAQRDLDTGRKPIREMIERSGFSRQIEIFEGLSPAEVNRVLNQSKVNLLLSRQEGGNRGIFEGFFADVPALVMRDHIGVRTEYLTPRTGRLFTKSTLVGDLLYFRDHWNEFHPRLWALEHIAPEVSSARLNSVLKHIALEQGERWTTDIVAKSNCSDQQYYPGPEAGRGLPSAETILSLYGRNRDSGTRVSPTGIAAGAGI